MRGYRLRCRSRGSDWARATPSAAPVAVRERPVERLSIAMAPVVSPEICCDDGTVSIRLSADDYGGTREYR